MVDGIPGPEAISEEIAREISRVHEVSYGEVAWNVDVAIHERFVAVVMDIELSHAERILIDAGNHASVAHTREAFQVAIAPTFTAIVEHATGRRVASFGARTMIEDPQPWSLEVFRFDGDAEPR
jgi:uncharacterized protein YbcI